MDFQLLKGGNTKMVNKTIKLVNEKTSKNGSRYLLVDFEDGERASCWDEDLFNKILNNIGKEVGISVTVKGDYTSIVNVIANNTIEVNPSLKTDKLEVKDDKVSMTHRDRMIIAQCLTKCYCSAAPVDISKEDVLETFHWYLEKL